jgi:pimeloyl-ACP methyl ester carboxylesterase
MLITYLGLCAVLYLNQEKLLFFPEKLDKDFKFSFSQNFEELNLKSTDGMHLNALLFKAHQAKGVIFYLHGNAGSLNSWGGVAQFYTDCNYDVLMVDYRSYGKRELIFE